MKNILSQKTAITKPIVQNGIAILPLKHYSFNWNLLPTTITHLTFGSAFNLPVDNKLPHSLTHLIFENKHNKSRSDDAFNHPIDHLPPHLIHLVLGSYFNQSVNKLPSTLKYFEAGDQFNHSIDNLPDSVTHIKLHFHKQPINKLPTSLFYLNAKSAKGPINYLPSTLTYLKASHLSITVDLPPNLQVYKIYSSFPSNLVLPNTLVNLKVVGNCELFPPNLRVLDFITDTEVTIPPNLQSLTLDSSLLPHDIPLTLSKININFRINSTPITAIQLIFTLPNLNYMRISFHSLSGNIKPLALPPKLVNIQLLENFYISEVANQLPFSQFINAINFTSAPLTSIKIHHANYTNDVRDVQFSNQLPPSLTELYLHHAIFTGPLPQSLKQLEIQTKTSCTLPTIPFLLTSLKCTNCQPLYFPPHLTYLYLDAFTEPLSHFPSSLKTLDLESPREESSFKMSKLPTSLRSLHAQKYSLASTTVMPPNIEYLSIAYSGKKLPEFPITIEEIALCSECLMS